MEGLGSLPPAETPMSQVSSFPILAISLIGMLSTTILLISYYLIVLKCCMNWRRGGQGGRLSDSHIRRLIIHAEQLHQQQGLDEKLIRAIPTVRFAEKSGPLHGCAICLGDFKDGEVLRRIPGCGHHFHVDCVDLWLKNSGSCPICRAEIGAEVGEGCAGEKMKGASKGDEVIDVGRGRGGEEGLCVAPVRRSVSMDSLGVEERRERRVGLQWPALATGEGGSGGAGGGGGALPQPVFLLGGSSRGAEIP